MEGRERESRERKREGKRDGEREREREREKRELGGNKEIVRTPLTG